MIKNLVKTRLPTGFGEFSLYLYLEGGKEHLALVKGEVANFESVPVRVHSECLTGDVFSSRRCDCGDQLKHTLMYLGRQKAGVLIYLRQEGRGIGLLKKMEAYNLQDQGLDTVEANIELGHQADERDYGIAARILRSLGVLSIRLITNNPHKVEELESNGIQVVSRIPIEVGHHEENLGYLKSKAERMAHLLRFSERVPEDLDFSFLRDLKDQLAMVSHAEQIRPFVTLTYAQSIDGLPLVNGAQGRALESSMGRYLRSSHDATLYFAEDLEGVALEDSGAAVIWDPELEWSQSHLMSTGSHQKHWVVAMENCDSERRAQLEQKGIRLLLLPIASNHRETIQPLLERLGAEGIGTLLVLGGREMIEYFLFGRFADYCVITLVPCFMGADANGQGPVKGLAQISDCGYQAVGSDLIAFGALRYGV